MYTAFLILCSHSQVPQTESFAESSASVFCVWLAQGAGIFVVL